VGTVRLPEVLAGVRGSKLRPAEQVETDRASRWKGHRGAHHLSRGKDPGAVGGGPVSAPAGLTVEARSGRFPGGSPGRPASGPRRAVLELRRIHPWSVFKVALLTSLVLAAVAMAAAAALYSGLGALGLPQTVNNLFAPVGGGSPVLTLSGFLGAAALLAALGAVLLTTLAPLAAALYNVCASLTGGLKVLSNSQDLWIGVLGDLLIAF